MKPYSFMLDFNGRILSISSNNTDWFAIFEQLQKTSLIHGGTLFGAQIRW